MTVGTVLMLCGAIMMMQPVYYRGKVVATQARDWAATLTTAFKPTMAPTAEMNSLLERLDLRK